MSINILELELEILVLKYGRQKVYKAFANIQGKSEVEIYYKVKSLKELKEKRASKKRPKKLPLEIAEEIISGSANEEQLNKLAILFQNKQFLPQLKDVRRFLERQNINTTVRSRSNSTRSIFETLKHCNKEELDELLIDSKTDEQSSFAKLSDQIIGNRGKIYTTQ